MLIPRKKPLKDLTHPNNVIVVYGTKLTFNDVVISESYFTRIIEPYMLEKNIHNMSLIIDQAPCHLTNKDNIALFSRYIKAKLTTKRLKNLLQPADVA